jgi:hypothetical protein
MGALLAGACSHTATGSAATDAGAPGVTTPPVSGGGEPTPAPPAPGVDAAAPAADAGTPAGDGPAPAAGVGPDLVVTPLSGTHLYFVGSMDNKRSVDATATFPEMPLSYERITLKFALRCPATGGCDAWDRRASFGVVRKVGDQETVTELLRFMTPYGVGASWSLDVTALRPLLSGQVTLRVFIDTWVGPGNPSGAGWLVDASFEMKGGRPERLPLAVIPLWEQVRFDYGDPLKPVAMAVPERTVMLPEGAASVELRSLITGHGQGNLENCAEFCRRDHTFTVAGKGMTRQIWRDDCARTSAPNQRGNFRSGRAGWCPGADVAPWVEDATMAVAGARSVTVAYAVAPYENSCRPDAPTCGGCALGTDCAFDNGAHTAPFYVLSAALIVYGR